MKAYKTIIKLTVIGFLLFSLTACPVDFIGDSTITIVNNSDKTIDFYFDSSSVLKAESQFLEPSRVYLKPYSKLEMYDWWLEKLEMIYRDHLFLFDKAVLDTVPWDTIRHHNMYLKRIGFTKQTLDSLNWTLTYP